MVKLTENVAGGWLLKSPTISNQPLFTLGDVMEINILPLDQAALKTPPVDDFGFGNKFSNRTKSHIGLRQSRQYPMHIKGFNITFYLFIT